MDDGKREPCGIRVECCALRMDFTKKRDLPIARLGPVLGEIGPKGLDLPPVTLRVTCENAEFIRCILIGVLAIRACHENGPNHKCGLARIMTVRPKGLKKCGTLNPGTQYAIEFLGVCSNGPMQTQGFESPVKRECKTERGRCLTPFAHLRPKGLEPPTPGSEDRCSIQLSYGRELNASRRSAQFVRV